MSRGRPFQSAALLRKEDAARIFCRNIWEQLGRNGIYGEICWLGEQDMVHNEVSCGKTYEISKRYGDGQRDSQARLFSLLRDAAIT